MAHKKTISFISSIILVIASTIGSGIFFKNQELAELSQGNLLLVIFSWVIGSLTIIFLSLSLSKIATIPETNRGLLGWASALLPKFLSRTIAFYEKLFYTPIIVFILSIYTSNLLFETINIEVSQSVIWLVAFSFFIWFMITNLISLKFSEFSVWIMTTLQFVPLVLFPILGFINFGNVGEGNTILQKNISSLPGLRGISPYMTMFLGLPSVLFSFVGFHLVASQRENLKHPQKLGKSIFYGVISVTVIYLLVSIAFNVGSQDGTHNTIKTYKWLSNLLKILIGVGILGVLNCNLMNAITQWKNVMLNNDSKEISFLHRFIWKQLPQQSSLKKQTFSVWLFFLLTISLFYILYGLIGIFATKSLNQLSGYIGNYSSLMMIIFLCLIVLAVFIKKPVVINWKLKVPALISVTLIFSSLFGLFIVSLVDSFGFNEADSISNLINLIILVVTIIISLTLGFISCLREKNTMLIKPILNENETLYD